MFAVLHVVDIDVVVDIDIDDVDEVFVVCTVVVFVPTKLNEWSTSLANPYHHKEE